MMAKLSASPIVVFLIVINSLAQAQQARQMPRLLIVSSYSKFADQERIDAFRKGLGTLGYKENDNVKIDTRWFGDVSRQARQSMIDADLRNLNYDVIVVSGGSAFARNIKKAVPMIPIVMTTGSDPIETGLISSLAQPGGNVTGLTSMTLDLAGKRLELLLESVPKLTNVAILFDGANQSKVLELKETRNAAQSLHIEIQPLDVRGSTDFEGAFKAAGKSRAQGLIALQNPLTVNHIKKIADLALNTRLPMMVAEKGILDRGGLMSYGPDYADLYRRAATYVDKILKGAKPADLPVEQPMKFEFVINLKTAKQIGLTIPPNVLVRADRVIR